MNEYTLLKEDTSKMDDQALNIVSHVYPKVVSMPVLIRDLICQECGWSVPTFYRKIRVGNRGEVRISNAEREKILEVVYGVLMEEVARIRTLQKKRALGEMISR